MTSPLDPPALALGLWDVAAVIGWLHEIEATDVPLIRGSIETSIPDMPDRIGIVTSVGGGPAAMDGIETSPRFQLRFRGTQADLSDAERLSLTADERIRFAGGPVTFNGVRLLRTDWAGGGPAAMPARTGRRPEHACTYVSRILRRN